jgi:hypothetical protein
MKSSLGKVIIIASLSFVSASSIAACCGGLGWLGSTGGDIINATASTSNDIVQPGAALVGNVWVGLGQLGSSCCGK